MGGTSLSVSRGASCLAVYGNTVEGQVLRVYNHRGELLWEFRVGHPADEGSREILTPQGDRVAAGFQLEGGYRLLGFSRGAQPDWQARVGSVLGALDFSRDGGSLVAATEAGEVSYFSVPAGLQQ